MAFMFSRLGKVDGGSRLLNAWRKHPVMIAGSASSADPNLPGEFDSMLPDITNGRAVSKRGGGGLCCVNVGDVGLTVKCGDGNMVAIYTGMVRCLEKLALTS